MATPLRACRLKLAHTSAFPRRLPNLAVGEYVSGLAVDESRGELWVLTSIGDIARYTDACPPVLIGRCNLGVIVGPNRAPAGLALDEANNLVFVAYSNWNTGQSDILVSRQATPCQTIQTLRALCFTGVPAPITGLAMDSCNDRLVLTSGLQVIEMTLIIVPGPTGPLARLVPGPCCTIPGADPLIGLAVRPGVATSSGVGCSNGSCLPCANEHVLRNDPMVGNPAFQLRLRNVPEGSLAYLAVSPGPCAPTPPFGPLCGPVGVNPALSTILGFELTGGTVGCAGSANFNIPIPNDPALCGRVFSSQGFVLCPAGAGGLAQTNCLSWEIRGS